MLVETIQRLQPVRSLAWPLQYGAAALVVLAFFALRYLLLGLGIDAGDLPLFVMFVPGIVLSALLFAKGAGYFAVAVSAALSLRYYLDPGHPFGNAELGDAIRILVFAAIGALTAAIVESLRRAVDELNSRSRQLAGARAELEHSLAELEASDAQKELLLHDVNHRIKNHLQLVSGYLLLGQRDARDEAAATLLGTAANRLKVLARVYDRLQLRRDATSVSARGFIEELVNDLQPTLAGLRPIVLQADAEEAELSSGRAATVGLMINELVSNAVRFAFEDDEPGNVYVYFRRCDEGFCLEVVDDGDGFRSEERSGSVGQRLLRGLVQQLGGTVSWSGPPGTRVSVSFPEEPGVGAVAGERPAP
jgi:two-component system, sensor histidine kinase PdtaS